MPESATSQFAYNVLNQLTSADRGDGLPTVNYDWDAEKRLAKIKADNKTTRFTYDGLGRCTGIRQLADGFELSDRRFVWCDNVLCEERNAAGIVLKRFFAEGMQMGAGPTSQVFLYTRDHLGSIREVTDSAGTVHARYSYDPFGRRTRVMGDLEADFGFAGMFWASEINLSMTRFRTYDAEIGRWLSRDPLTDGELLQGPNLYMYVHNDPVNRADRWGLQHVEPKDPNPDPDAQPMCLDPFGGSPLDALRGLAACLACLLELGVAVRNRDFTFLTGGSGGGVGGHFCAICVNDQPNYGPCPPPGPPPDPPTPPPICPPGLPPGGPSW